MTTPRAAGEAAAAAARNTALGCEASGDREGAIAAYAAATAAAPWSALAWADLGLAQMDAGRYADAESAFARAAELDPTLSDAHTNLGLLRLRRADPAAAREALDRAAALPGADHTVFHNLAFACVQTGDRGPALKAVLAALRLAPDSIPSLTLLIDALVDVVEPGFALQVLARLDALAGPTAAPQLRMLAAIRRAVLVTAIEPNGEAIARRRADLWRAIAQLDAAVAEMPVPAIRSPLTEIPGMLFYLAYHGENDRPLKQAFAASLLHACPDLGWTAPHLTTDPRPPALRDPGGGMRPVRLAIVSARLRTHTIGALTLGLVRAFDRAVVAPRLFIAGPEPDDPVQQAFRAAAPAEDLAADLATARTQIAAFRPDVVLYPDVGMARLPQFLAFARLAPVQAASWGHPETTGIPAIDAFLSAEAIEPPDACDHYSERLVRLPALPGVYARLAVPMALSRTAIGLPATGTMYLCAQTPFKFHPDFDPVLRRILDGDPSGILVVPQGPDPALMRALEPRLRGALGPAAARFHVVPFQPHAQFLALLRSADVLLDTPGFGGGLSSAESFAMGRPIVTWRGRFMRGRITAALYERMGLGAVVAEDADAYVACALRLGRDAEARADLARRIDAASAVLFDDPGGAAAIGRWARAATAAAAVGHPVPDWPEVLAWEVANGDGGRDAVSATSPR